ncbi:MAG: OmpA family protein [Acidobacteria bacterium]|nr:OmpA family protein [Acidobacteriota bacterium]
MDFDTGHAELETQHKTFLTEAINRAKTNSAFHIRIYGFASHLGDIVKNKKLSLARMQSVYNFLKNQDGRVLNSIQMWEPLGESKSPGGENDDSPEFRAVEVHIFIGDMPPIDPPGKKKVDPPNKPVLPGGPRSGRWSVAAPGGATFTIGPSVGPVTVGGTIGANFFFVRNELTHEVRKYAALALGFGVSLGIPVPFKSLQNALQTLLTGPNFSGVSFTTVFPPHAVTFEEVESCLVTVVGGNAGIFNPALSGSVAVITFNCPGVMQFGPSGTPIKVAEDIWSFNSSGRNFQVGAGASGTTGPLIKL